MQEFERSDAEVTPGVLVTMDGAHEWAHQAEDGTYSVEKIQTSRPPFTENGESLQISSDMMVIGTPYPFYFVEWWFVVVKRENGELDFYYLDG